MKPLKNLRLSVNLAAAITLGACGGTVEDEAIDTNPATLEAADLELEKLDTLLSQRPGDPTLLAVGKQLRDSMEELNGLVDRIDIAPDHSISFYRNEHSAGVAERLPQGGQSALDAPGNEGLSVEQIYATLAPDRVIPAVLRALTSPAVGSFGAIGQPEGPQSRGGQSPQSPRSAGDVEDVQSALTAADGELFSEEYCPKTEYSGDWAECKPNWGGGRTAYGRMRRTDASVAPYRGDMVRVRWTAPGIATHTFAVFKGEVLKKARWIVPLVNVPTRSCCFICACPTEALPRKAFMQWDVLEASGDGFHWGVRFTNFGNHRDP